MGDVGDKNEVTKEPENVEDEPSEQPSDDEKNENNQ